MISKTITGPTIHVTCHMHTMVSQGVCIRESSSLDLHAWRCLVGPWVLKLVKNETKSVNSADKSVMLFIFCQQLNQPVNACADKLL